MDFVDLLGLVGLVDLVGLVLLVGFVRFGRFSRFGRSGRFCRLGVGDVMGLARKSNGVKTKKYVVRYGRIGRDKIFG